MFWKKPRKESQSVLAQGGFSLGNSTAHTSGSTALASDASSASTAYGRPVQLSTSNSDFLPAKEGATQPRAACVVPRGRILSGTFSFTLPVRIEGTIRGRLFSSSTVILAEGSRAEVDGTVSKLVCSGAIIGGAFVADAAELRPTAVLDTRLVAKSLSAAPGSIINGELLIGS